MSILINLLPDLRQAKLRNMRRRQLASGVSVVIWSVCAGLILLLFVYWGGQEAIIKIKSTNITKQIKQLRDVPGINDALTAQQHLAALPDLYANRIYISKFLSVYAATNPVEVTLTSLSLDAANQLKVTGTASSYASVAKLARAMELSNISIGPGFSKDNIPYFSDIKIGGLSAGSTGKVNFTLDVAVGTGALTNGN